MAIEIISGEKARETLDNNQQAFWPTPQYPDRLYPLATPAARANFKIKADERIFCIGSCFAREIGEALQRLEFEVLSLFNNLPKSAHRKRSDGSMFNKYNVASIYNELYWACYPEQYCHDKVFIEIDDKRLQDYQLTGANYSDEARAAQQFREAFNNAFQLVKSADVVVLTLGLSEVWFDCHTGLYLNMAPTQALFERYPKRFELHVFDYQQTAKFLDDIYTLLQQHLKPSFRLLITVSPIPLFATFRDQDILVANSYSKAVLRCAVEQFLVNKTNACYFPSYELVNLSNASIIWNGEDFRHVNRAVIDYIMGHVMLQFTNPSEAINETNAIAKATALYQGNFFNEAITTLKPFIKAKGKKRLELVLLFNAIRLRVSGRYKALILEAVVHLRANAQNKPRQLLSDFLYGYKKISNRDFMGYVEQWDGQYLTGWACHLKKDSPIKVNIMVDNKIITSVLAGSERLDVAAIYGSNARYCGFHIALNRAQLATDSIRVTFATNKQDLRHSPIILSEHHKNRLIQQGLLK